MAYLGTFTFAISFWRAEDERDESWRGARLAKFYTAFDPQKEGLDNYWERSSLFVDSEGRGAEGVVPKPPYLWISTPNSGISWRDLSWFFCTELRGLQVRIRPARLQLYCTQSISAKAPRLRSRPSGPGARRSSVRFKSGFNIKGSTAWLM